MRELSHAASLHPSPLSIGGGGGGGGKNN